MLYIINKSFINSNALALVKVDDIILLIEDGVYAACSPGETLAKPGNIYALKPDVIARGLSDKISLDIKLVDYDGFVDLVVQNNPIFN